MPRLGIRQLELLKACGTTHAIVTPDKTTRRLVDLGMMKAEPDGSFVRVTPNGLRALADAVDAGRIKLCEIRNKDKDTPS